MRAANLPAALGSRDCPIEARDVVRSFGQTPALRRTAFGFVFQFGQLVPELSAADNIALPLLLNKAKRAEPTREQGSG
jgi:ABC-type lipoprotein export system ATPase subunit